MVFIFWFFRNHQVAPTPNILEDSLGWQIAKKQHLVLAFRRKKE